MYPSVFKCTSQWYSIHSYDCATIATIHSQNLFHLVKLELFTHETLPNVPSPQSPALPFYSVFLNLTTLGTSYKWYHAVFVFL